MTPETFLENFSDYIEKRRADTLYCYAGYTGFAGALLIKVIHVGTRIIIRPWLRIGPVGALDITRSLERYKSFRGQVPNIHVHVAVCFRDNALRQVSQSTFQALLAVDAKKKSVTITGTRNMPQTLVSAIADFCGNNGIDLSYDYVGTVVNKGKKGTSRETIVAASNGKPPQLFISYSWDDDAHKLWVLKLAADLTRNGFRVLIDEWDLPTFNDDLHLFMETGIRDSNFVLMVCTPSYAKKANVRTGGVGVESTIITGEFYDAAKANKFLAVTRGPGGTTACLPSYLKSRFAIDFSQDSDYKAQLETLLRRLLRRPRYRRPDLGELPELGSEDL